MIRAKNEGDERDGDSLEALPESRRIREQVDQLARRLLEASAA